MLKGTELSFLACTELPGSDEAEKLGWMPKPTKHGRKPQSIAALRDSAGTGAMMA